MWSGCSKLDFLPEPDRKANLGFDPRFGLTKRSNIWKRVLFSIPILLVSYAGTQTFGAALAQMLPKMAETSKTGIFIVNEKLSVPMVGQIYGLSKLDNLVRLLIGFFVSSLSGFDPLGQLQTLAFLADVFPVLTIWLIESARRANSFTFAEYA